MAPTYSHSVWTLQAADLNQIVSRHGHRVPDSPIPPNDGPVSPPQDLSPALTIIEQNTKATQENTKVTRELINKLAALPTS